MEILIKKLFANISFAMLRILDGVFELFGYMTGIQEVPANGEQEGGTLLTVFFQHEGINRVFVWLIIISWALLGIFTIVGIIKSMVTKKNPVSKVLVKFAGAFLGFFVMQIVVLEGIALSEQVLQEVNASFVADQDGQEQVTLSQRIFALAVEDQGWREDDDGKKYSSKDFNPSMNADEVFGMYKRNMLGLEKPPGFYEDTDEESGEDVVVKVEDDGTLNNPGIVRLYNTNIFLLFASTLIIFILILTCLITLAKRLFEVLFYYLCMPLAVSTIPMDDGAKFKLWGEAIISKVLAVFGTVIAINLYILFLGVIGDGIQLGQSSWLQTIFNLVLMIGGAMAASSGAALFGRMIGAAQDSGRGLGSMLYTGMTIGGVAAGAARGAGRLIFGRRGGGGGAAGGGGRTGGLIRTAGSALNATGKLLGGNRYTAMRDNVGGSYSRLKEQLRGNFMGANGLLGMGAKAGANAIGAVSSVPQRAADAIKGKFDGI